MTQIRAAAPRVVVVIGSAFQARTPKNPFTWQERTDMIRQTLSAADQERTTFLPIRDYYDEEAWLQAVRTGVEALSGQRTSICLIGHFDAHGARFDARDERRVARINAELARFAGEHDKLRFAGVDLLFGADDVNVQGMYGFSHDEFPQCLLERLRFLERFFDVGDRVGVIFVRGGVGAADRYADRRRKRHAFESRKHMFDTA